MAHLGSGKLTHCPDQRSVGRGGDLGATPTDMDVNLDWLIVTTPPNDTWVNLAQFSY